MIRYFGKIRVRFFIFMPIFVLGAVILGQSARKTQAEVKRKQAELVRVRAQMAKAEVERKKLQEEMGRMREIRMSYLKFFGRAITCMSSVDMMAQLMGRLKGYSLGGEVTIFKRKIGGKDAYLKAIPISTNVVADWQEIFQAIEEKLKFIGFFNTLESLVLTPSDDKILANINLKLYFADGEGWKESKKR